MLRTSVAQQSGTVPVRPPGHPSLPIGPAMALATKRAATAKNFILNVVVVLQQGVDRCMCKRVVVIVREDADEDEEKKSVDDGEEGRLYTFFSSFIASRISRAMSPPSLPFDPFRTKVDGRSWMSVCRERNIAISFTLHNERDR